MSRERRDRTTPLMMGRVLGPQDSLDGTAERFFAEGDEHERRGWNDVLPVDEELEPTRRYGSVDRVPRRWGAVLGLVVLCLCLAVGAAVGVFALFSKDSLRSWFKGTSHAPAAMSPAKQTAPAAPPAEPEPPAQPEAERMAPPKAAPVAQPVVEAAPKPEKAAAPPDLEGAERLRQDAIAVRKRRQRAAEKDYIWSQELKALVPASSLENPPAQPSPR